MSGALQYSEGGLAAEDVLLRPATAGHTDGAEDRAAVHDRNTAAFGHDATAVGNDKAAKPWSPRLRRQLCCGQVKGGRRVGLIEGKLCAPGSRLIHPPNGDGRAGLVDDRGRYCHPLSSRVGVSRLHHFPRLVEGNRPHCRFVFAKECGVDLDGGLMFGRDVDIFENRVHRANDLALLAIDADFRVDIELRGPGRGMNAGYRADLDAGAIVGTQTCNDVGH